MSRSGKSLVVLGTAYHQCSLDSAVRRQADNIGDYSENRVYRTNATIDIDGSCLKPSPDIAPPDP